MSRSTPKPATARDAPAGDRPVKAVGLMSGGLDSTLAARLLRDQGVDVVGLYFNTGFCTYDHHRAIGRKGEDPRRLRSHALQAGAEAQVELRVVDVADEYLEMVKHPKHGYGAAANPCIDCRIFMLRKAREVADREGAEVVFTGEVLGQRPMSQHRQALDMIERESGLEGRLLRPLSAQHLPATRAEQEGRITRETLLDIRGRSRRDQESLAADLDIEEYPQPSGGCCFLADRNFGARFHDLMTEETHLGRSVGRDEIMMLKVGRHFRLSQGVKAIVGRDEGENHFLERFRGGRWRVTGAEDIGPVTIVTGAPSDDEIGTAAAITARYGDGRMRATVRILAERFPDATRGIPETPAASRTIEVAPARDADLGALRVGA